MWPVSLSEGPLVLRALRRRDGAQWATLRRRNAAWLAPWEATVPDPHARPLTFGQYVRELNRQGREGTSLPWAVALGGALAGQVTVSGITHGSLSSASIGYWIDRGLAGRGLTPLAVAMAADHCFGAVGLHRVEINIRPQNAASLRVVEKLGFRDEGVRRAYLHIQGAWADHRTFALTREEVPAGLRERALALPHTLSRT
ncbi:GNAT family N-acetyltransferase [Serinibacter salmoneus]|uniref:Ribosomal-protein-alanine N-acetyltransferase n=1 Tax=Serinibacter salmoneus TaxID=556530 RepID=A0A2A9D2D5_9MICO|nr:GNAT family protein [Serinibacter salmoneus]PFG20496.1 ribosomal-protein-alanine N-acetyltransferase [Serinibacter salmoneus]